MVFQSIKHWIQESPSTRDPRFLLNALLKGGLTARKKGLYDAQFYQGHLHRKEAYAELGQILSRFRTFDSAVDYGCGNAYLIEYLHGVGKKVAGYDGSNHILDFIASELRGHVSIRNLAAPFASDKYDLAISTEVAEHIPKNAADTFVENICSAANSFVFFTAAGRGQWGDGHINCQDKSYWHAKFRANGLVPPSDFDVLDQAIKGNAVISLHMPWLAPNVMFFERM